MTLDENTTLQGTDDSQHEPPTPDIKITKWNDLTDDQKSDIEFLKAQKAKYEQDVENYENDTNYKKITKKIDAITKALDLEERKLRKELQKADDQEAKQDRYDKLSQYWEGILKTREIYYVADEHVFYEYFPGEGEWKSYPYQGLLTLLSVKGGDSKEAFMDVLEELGRKKVSAEFSFYPKNPNILNMMKRDHWLKPVEGEPHSWFDLMLTSLGGGKKDAAEHIEQVVCYKYLHPEEYRLPCCVFHGEGGAGKNTFVEEVLGTIFGEKQVACLDVESSMGQYNGLMQGKTAILIDEAVSEKTNSDKFKRMVGNKTINVNAKYGKQNVVDNTPLYFAGGNDNSGAILLSGNATDRRWSIIKLEKSLIDWVMEQFNLDKPAAVEKYRENMWVFNDRAEVGKWLNSIIQKWGSMTQPPEGLHGEDYHDLRETQKTPFDELMEFVFNDPDFSHIRGEDLYDMLKWFTSNGNPAARGVKSKNKFYEDVRVWLKRNSKPNIVWKKLNITKGGHIASKAVKERTSANCFALDNISTAKDNHDYYFEPDEFGHDQVRIDRPEPIVKTVDDRTSNDPMDKTPKIGTGS